MMTGDTKTVLAFVRDVAKDYLSASPSSNTVPTTVPIVEVPSGGALSVGSKIRDDMSMDEYRASREA